MNRPQVDRSELAITVRCVGYVVLWFHQYLGPDGMDCGAGAVRKNLAESSDKSLPRFYVYFTGGFVALFTTVLISLTHRRAHQSFFTTLGFISVFGWNSSDLPQLVTNWQLRSTAGLALPFTLFGVAGVVCDLISTYGLDWGLPNKIGCPISLLLKLFLLWQFWKYRKNIAGAPC